MGFWVIKSLLMHYHLSPTGAFIFVALAVCFPFGCLYSLIGCCTVLTRYHSLLLFCLSFPSLWIIADYLKELIPLLIPWGTIGYAAIPWQAFVQIGDIVVLYGISFIIVTINCSCFF
jgi:apolipoprotein N-acyltransferase